MSLIFIFPLLENAIRPSSRLVVISKCARRPLRLVVVSRLVFSHNWLRTGITIRVASNSSQLLGTLLEHLFVITGRIKFSISSMLVSYGGVIQSNDLRVLKLENYFSVMGRFMNLKASRVGGEN